MRNPPLLNILVITKELRLIIKFGYFGWEYSGFQRGNGSNSVEDAILRVMEREGISGNIQSAARTDKGVSATSNAFAVDTERKPSMVMGVLNGKIPGMVFHSYAMVDDEFNPRHCDYKIYRYIIQKDQAGPYLKQALKPFRGRHDFRNFCKMDERNPIRTIRSIAVNRKRDMVSIDYKARSFLWNQIRSITSYATEQSFSEEQTDPFSLEEKYPKLMDPEGLILLDMVYDGIEFREYMPLSKKKYLDSRFKRENMRHEVMKNFTLVTK